MKIGSTAIILAEVAEKIDNHAIDICLAKIHIPPTIIAEYDELVLAVIVRGDDVYPEEHYREGMTLVLSLQFDPEQIKALTTEQATQLICNKAEQYLAGIREVEERAYEEMLDEYGDPIIEPL